MKFSVKTIQGRQIMMEAAADTPIPELKVIVANHKDICYKLQGLKLVHQGKVLADNKKLQDDVKENDFVVVVGTSRPADAPPAKLPTEEGKTEAKGDDKGDSSNVVTAVDQEKDKKQQELIDTVMAVGGGWPKEEVEKALTAANNNADKAIGYLMDGNIPQPKASPPPPAQPPPPQPVSQFQFPSPPSASAMQAGAAQTGLLGPLPPGTDAEHTSQLIAQLLAQARRQAQGTELEGALRTIPHWDNVRQEIMDRPESITPIMETLKEERPGLHGLISANQAEFLRLIKEGLPQVGGHSPTTSPVYSLGSAGAAPLPIPTMSSLNENDRAAVERLISMGIAAKERCIEAYFACEKSEEVAAGLLVEEAFGAT
eukprot:TRINITY_DN62947_c0_g1_i3.p1 TRINITY_DN62947_c0_g1~~TRINITY_DN62947_c0_g1_i3.p1  ORF type:complete len:371 (+),score=66.87 TRINITY_DN62947_c0_g1_i3:47-1159(+)